MSLRIDKSRLHAKYALEVYKMVGGYPSTIDVLYELVRVLEDRNSLDSPFVGQSLMREVVTREAGKDLEDTLIELADQGWLKKDGESYLLLGHPWTETNINS